MGRRARPRSSRASVKRARAPVADDLLFELGTEELPPTSLKVLSEALATLLYRALQDVGLTTAASPDYRVYATPRRLAIYVPGILRRQPNRIDERRGPALSAAFAADGRPTPAALGFARSCGVEPHQLERLETDKGAWLVYRQKHVGKSANKLIPDLVSDAVKNLPVAKRMRWADLDVEFVRPVHWVVLLHGRTVVRCKVLSVRSGRQTYGHRFHCPKALAIAAPRDY
ncbi:MAG: glycine--tRNA ligase subunit beta, partial [Acidiferrobacterales bacterium]|nr:glycine--tRNA ligase subunit beta [Acidiferrobacterales bacterium]